MFSSTSLIIIIILLIVVISAIIIYRTNKNKPVNKLMIDNVNV